MSLRPLAKLSRILAVYSKIEVSDDEFTPLSKAEPYIGRMQQNSLLLLFGCPGCPFFGGFLVLFFSYSFRGFYLTPILVSRPDHPQVDATGHLMAQILYLIQKKKGILTYLKGIAHGSSTSCQNPPTGQYVAFCVAG